LELKAVEMIETSQYHLPRAMIKLTHKQYVNIR
jgi:hypothetical protein